MSRFLLILLLAVLPGACGATVRMQAAFAAPVDSQVDAALTLPPELRHAVQAEVVARSAPGRDRLERLLAFMLADDGMALRYVEQPTYDLAESYERRAVNCLSFTLMFVALAREAGMRAYPQASDDALSMRVVNNTLFRATHVNAGVFVDGKLLVADVGSDILVAGRPPRRISDAAALALLHNNWAVEALLQGDGTTAAMQIAGAIAIYPANATLWSNAGVIDWRAGRLAQANAAYKRALKLRRDHIGALGNLLILLESGASNADMDVDKVRARLTRAKRKDPFSQFVIAESKMGAGDLGAAITHYQRAIRLLPDQPSFYRSLADAYERRGEIEASRRATERADSLDAERESRQMKRTTLPNSG